MTAKVTSTAQGRVMQGAVLGTIDEATEFAELIPPSPMDVHVDMSGVDRINSLGVRQWLNFVADLERAGSRLGLHRCPPVVVGQLNMISNFAGTRGVVFSVLAPFACSHCGHEILQPVDLNQAQVSIAATRPCDKCSRAMDFDDVLEIYLDFRNSRTRAANR